MFAQMRRLLTGCNGQRQVREHSTSKDSIDYIHLPVSTHCTHILQSGFRVGDCKRVRLSAFDYEADDDDNLSIQVLPSLVACQMHPKVYARCLTGRCVFGYEFLRRREMFLW